MPESIKKSWEQIDSLAAKGLFAQAVEMANSVLEAGLVKASYPEAIRALIERNKYIIRLEDDGIIKVIHNTENLLAKLPKPFDHVVQSLLANYYWQFFLEYQWQLGNTASESDDLLTWSGDQIRNKINTLYSSSIQLDQEHIYFPLDTLQVLLDSTESKQPWSFMYDLLAHKALQYWQNDFTVFPNTPVQDLFLIDLFDIDNLNEISIVDLRISEYQKKSLLAYQRWLHLYDESKNSRVLLDLRYLEYALNISKLPGAKSRYLYALERMADQYNGQFGFSSIAANIAELLLSQSGNENRYLQAKEWCSLGLAGDETEIGHARCYNLLQRIEQKTVSLSTEQVYLPNSPIQVNLDTRNLDQLNFAIYRLPGSVAIERFPIYSLEEQIEALSSVPLIREFIVDINSSPLLLNVNEELSIEGLETGQYVILAEAISADKNKKALSCTRFQVSSLNYVLQQDKLGFQLYTIDRGSGGALSDVEIVVTRRVYKNRSQSREIVFTANSGQYGDLYLSQIEMNENYEIFLRKGNDLLTPYTSHYNATRYPVKKDPRKTLIFTDRSLYRPGQSVYFSAILVEGRNKQGNLSIAANQMVTIELLDPNLESVGKIEGHSNQYGIVSGQFWLPAQRLNGNYQISCSFSQDASYVKVESYKRPTFTIDLHEEWELKGNEQLVVSGSVHTLTGIPVSNASGRFTIQTIPFWRFAYSFPNSQPKEIFSGVIETDELGRFEISYNWLDTSQIVPVRISVEFSDVTGETQTADQNYWLRKSRGRFEIKAKDSYLPKELNSLSVHAVDFNEPKLIDGKFTIHQIETKRFWYPGKYWQSVDKTDSLLPENQRLGALLIQEEVRKVDEWVLDVSNRSWEPGYYRATLVVQNDTIETTFLVQTKQAFVDSPGKEIFQIADHFEWISQPGEELVIPIARRVNDVDILVFVERNDEIRSFWTTEEELHLAIDESDYGKIMVSMVACYSNRVTKVDLPISIPNKNMTLEIRNFQYDSIALPGSDQSIRFQVVDHEEQPVFANMTITMYDAALDEIYSQPWPILNDHRIYRMVNLQIPSFGVSYPLSRSSDVDMRPTKVVVYPNFVEQFLTVRDPRRYRSMDHAVVESAALADQSSALEKDGGNAPSEESDDLRSEFAETTLFLTDVNSDEQGWVTINFRHQDATTKWKVRIFAHSKEVATAFHEFDITTKKDVWVEPFFPRLVYAGDQIVIPAKIINTLEHEIEGSITLTILDEQGNNLNKLLGNEESRKSFQTIGNRSLSMGWKLNIPDHFVETITLLYELKADSQTDAVRKQLPIISNLIEVIETKPFEIANSQSKSWEFEGQMGYERYLLFHSDPKWLAIQSIPLLFQQSYLSTDQLFQQFLLLKLAHRFFNQHPDLRRKLMMQIQAGEAASPIGVGDQTLDLFQTTWVGQQKQETKQIRDLARLANQNLMVSLLKSLEDQIRSRESENGLFPWFDGGRENIYITARLFAIIADSYYLDGGIIKDSYWTELLEKMASSLDQEFHSIWSDSRKRNVKIRDRIPNFLDYLTARYILSPIVPVADQSFLIEIKDSLKTQWAQYPAGRLADFGIIAIESNDETWANEIEAALVDQQIENEKGIYWKDFDLRYDVNVVHSQAKIIQFYFKRGRDIRQLQKYLMLHKLGNRWSNNADLFSGILALMRSEINLLQRKPIEYILNGKDRKQLEFGFQETKIPITDQIRSILVKNPTEKYVFGSMVSIGMQKRDRIDISSDQLIIKKEIFIKSSDGGKTIWIPLKDGQSVQVGDQIKVKLLIESAQDLQFIHIEDDRPAGSEPLAGISGYRFANGLFFYQTVDDRQMHFFLDRLPKGKFYVEYDCYLSHMGTMQTGSAHIQSFYSTRYADYSESLRIEITADTQ